MKTAEEELMECSRWLLDAISKGDWEAYARLADPTITCFEPEALGHLVAGLPFHKFYFDLGASSGPRHTTLIASHVRVMGDSAVVCYTRMTQYLDASGTPHTSTMEETRIWQKKDGQWKHVHFHRSPPGRA